MGTRRISPDPGDGWIRIDDIARSELAAEHKIALVAMAIEELGVAQALVMIHGREHGAEVYAAHGGHVRFNDDGDPVVPVAFGRPSKSRRPRKPTGGN